MIVRRMRWDQKQTFNKCFVDNGDGTFSITTSVVSGGSTSIPWGRRDVIDIFMKSIVNNSMQVSA